MNHGTTHQASYWRTALLLSAMLVIGCQGAESQTSSDIHPSKQLYATYPQWPATAPGNITLSQYTPFRAVYERNYTNGNGEERIDRVIVTSERIAWGEEGAISVSLIDAGSREYTDTTARTQTRFFAENDLRLIFQLTPVPGTPMDYIIARVNDGVVKATGVQSATGQAQHREETLPGAGWGAPGIWVIGSMPLETGMQIRLDPYPAVASSNILGTSSYHVTGHERVTLPDGKEHDAWVVEYPLGMTNGRIMQLLVMDRPPYLFAKRPYDADTGEVSERSSLRLLEYHTFGN